MISSEVPSIFNDHTTSFKMFPFYDKRLDEFTNIASDSFIIINQVQINVIVNDTKVKRLEKIKQIEKAQVLITSYGLLRQDIDEYTEYYFDTMFLDEAQNIKNPRSDTAIATKQVKARVKFALTGTPLENSIDFKLSQQSKAKYPIVVTLSGIITEVNSKLRSNAWL